MTSKTGAIALLFFFRSGLVRRESLELFLLILLSFAGRHVYVKGGRDGNVGEVEVERIEEREIVEGMGQSQGATRSIFLVLGTPSLRWQKKRANCGRGQVEAIPPRKK